MRPLLLLLIILSQGCSMLQSRREMMVEACKKQPDLVISSFSDESCEWSMTCGGTPPTGCNKGVQ